MPYQLHPPRQLFEPMKRNVLLRTHRCFHHPEKVRTKDKFTSYYVEYGANLVLSNFVLYLNDLAIDVLPHNDGFEAFITQDIINAIARFKSVESVRLNAAGQLEITNIYNERVKQILRINPCCTREHEGKYITTVLKDKTTGETKYLTDKRI